MKIATRVVGIVVVSCIFVFLLWKLPQWYVADSMEILSAKDLLTLENDARTTLAQILGGLLVLFGLVFSWQNLLLARRTAEKNFKASDATLRLSLERHGADQYARAVEQLGHKEIQVRLGGIYSLEGVARSVEQYHLPVMEVLTGYIRNTVPWKSREKEIPEEPNPDIQAILNVIGRRSHSDCEPIGSLDLVEVDLRKAHLAALNLKGINFARSHLEEATLRSAHLENAILAHANLEGADLRGAILTGAYLSSVNLRYAKLENACFVGAVLNVADLSHTIGLKWEQLAGADIQFATFPEHITKQIEAKNIESRKHESGAVT